jgi:hypothetical protein
MAARKGRPAAGSSLRGVQAQGTPASTGGAQRTSGGRALPPYTRPALAPALLAAVVLLACVAIVDAPAFVFARWGVAVLALIVLVFAIRARLWWGAVVAAAIAVLWNPVVVIPLPDVPWRVLQLAAAAAFVVLGMLVKVPRETD